MWVHEERRSHREGGGDRSRNVRALPGPRVRSRGYRAVHFNFVISTNERAVRLSQSLGFEIIGRLPGAFRHPSAGYVDAFVMYQQL